MELMSSEASVAMIATNDAVRERAAQREPGEEIGVMLERDPARQEAAAGTGWPRPGA